MKKQMKINVEIEDIYREEITLETAQELMKIVKVREKLLEDQKTRNKEENGKKKSKCTEILCC